MKIIPSILVCLALCQGIVWANEEDSDFECDRYLLESYDLNGTEDQVEDQNFLCPGVSANCCSYSDQVQIYKKFVVMEEQSKMKKVYREFPLVYEKIFKTFAVIEGLAQQVENITKETPGSNCLKFSEAIIKMKASKMNSKFRAAVRTAFDFLLKSREGFYCMLCDARAHQYFDIKLNEMHGSWGFCAHMVEEAMNYFHFRNNYFVKISRLYSEFLTKCDLRGKYYKNRFLKHEMKFFTNDKMAGTLNKCDKGWNKPGAMLACEGFCKRFHPAKYSPHLEGDLDKLYNFEKNLTKLITRLKKKADHDNKAEVEYYKNNGRQLSEEKETKKTRLEEDVNEINEFNKKFKTAFVRPITYVLKEDILIYHNLDTEESLFGQGVENIYNLVDFKSKIKPEGLNYYFYGEMQTIDKDAAMKAFEKIDENNVKDEEKFEKLVSG